MAEDKIYTKAEVAQHKTWVIIRNNVYDFADYLENHPGGAELITEHAGKDATKAFDDFGHSIDAKNEMKKYKIGVLHEDDRVQKVKRVPKTNAADVQMKRSCMAIITCGLCG